MCTAGDVLVSPLSQLHTENLEFHGAAGTRTIRIGNLGLNTGALVELQLVFANDCANGLELIFQNVFGSVRLGTFTRAGSEPNANLQLYCPEGWGPLRVLSFSAPGFTPPT